MAKNVLFVFRHAPYGSSIAREGLDALLAAAAYDQDIAVLFLNDGVFQLVSCQDTEASCAKNHARMVSALAIYGVDQVYVHHTSLDERGLTETELLLDPTVLSDAQTRALLASFDQLLSF